MRLALSSRHTLLQLFVMFALPIFLNAFAEQQAALELPVKRERASLPVPNPTQSFWIDTPHANPLAKEGSQGALTHDADICIIGSGITGVSAAYHLSRLFAEQQPRDPSATPRSIVILEARDFCSGATGRNGGHLTPNAFQDFAGNAALRGEDEAIRAIALEKHTAAEIVKLVEDGEKEEDVDLVKGGHVTLLFTESEVLQTSADYDAAKAAGIDVDDVHFLTKEQVNKTYGAAYPAVRIPGHNIWPLKLVTYLYALANHTAARSAVSTLTLHTNTPVTAIEPVPAEDERSRRWNLTTPRGSVACAHVLHATNAYAAHLLPHLHGPAGIVPARGQVVALRAAAPLETLTRTGWGGNEGFEYWFPRPLRVNETHPLVILGGGREATRPAFELYTVDDATVNPAVGQTLRQFLPAVFPGKYEAGREPEMEWTGIMGFTKTSDPFVGPVIDPSNPDAHKGQYISAGYTGHGMTRAYGCAEAVAQMIVADINGTEWTIPDWLPRHHLTKNRLEE